MYKHSQYLLVKKTQICKTARQKMAAWLLLFLFMQFIFNVFSECAGNSRLQSRTHGFYESFIEREETIALRMEGQINLHANDKLELWVFIWALKYEVALSWWKRTKGFEVCWDTERLQWWPGEDEKADTEHSRIIASYAVWGLEQGLKDTVLSLPFCIIHQRRVV